jgi:hypothetical protein
MNRSDEAGNASRPLAVPVILVLISATHLAYVPLAELQTMPVLPPAFALSVALGCGYALSAWRARRGNGFRTVISLVIGENLGVLAAGLVLGSPWETMLRPGTPLILGLQLALTLAEIWRRQESGQPIVAPARLAWFVLASALALAALIAVKPSGLWAP